MPSAEIQGRLWNPGARDWAELQESQHAGLWASMFDATRLGTGDRIVDIGCGSGGAAKLAADRGAIVAGVDAVPEMIQIASERVPDGDFHVGDLESFPFHNAAFDVAIAANSIQFAEDPLNALREAARVVKPGGQVAVAIWGHPDNSDARAIFEAVVEVLPEKPPGEGPFALSMPGVLEELMHSAGFENLRRETVKCAMSFDDLQLAWRGLRSAGPLQAAMSAVGE